MGTLGFYDGVMEKSSKIEKQGEYHWRHHNAEEGGVARLPNHAARYGEGPAHEIDGRIFRETVEEGGDPCQQGGQIPFALKE